MHTSYWGDGYWCHRRLNTKVSRENWYPVMIRTIDNYLQTMQCVCRQLALVERAAHRMTKRSPNDNPIQSPSTRRVLKLDTQVPMWKNFNAFSLFSLTGNSALWVGKCNKLGVYLQWQNLRDKRNERLIWHHITSEVDKRFATPKRSEVHIGGGRELVVARLVATLDLFRLCTVLPCCRFKGQSTRLPPPPHMPYQGCSGPLPLDLVVVLVRKETVTGNSLEAICG